MDSKELTISTTNSISHVLIFPLPIQSAINTMLKFSEILCHSGLDVTFLNTEQNHARLVNCTNIESRLEQYSGFCFQTIPDGLPEDHPRSAEQFQEMLAALQAMAEPYLRDKFSGSDFTCFIVDDLFYYASDIAHEIGIPVVHFTTSSPALLWILSCIPKTIEAGEFPSEGSDSNKTVTTIPGMEGLLRMCDLPYLGPGDYSNPNWQAALLQVQRLPLANGLILNTFDKLDGPIVNHLKSQCPNLYCIGPIHQHYKNTILDHDNASSYSNNLWEEDRGCLNWLDDQEPNSVIYVSVGSLYVMKKQEFTELWHGLVNSGVNFLWSIRPNSVDGGIPDHLQVLKEGQKGGSCIVRWVPQEQVLAHKSIGGSLTHSGWATTLECIVEGVPMICWPQYNDQQISSRLVNEVWKNGLDMKDTSFGRENVEKMVREVMVTRKEEFHKSAKKLSNLANGAITEGGSSYGDLKRLISDIELRNLKPTKKIPYKD